MALLDPVQLVDETTDKEGRLTQNYKVTCTNVDGLPSENIETIANAVYTGSKTPSEYQKYFYKLPKEFDPNPYRKDGIKQTFVSEISVKRSGTDYNTFAVSVKYDTAGALNSRSKDKNLGKYLYAWEEPTEYSESNSVMEEFLYSTDELGQPTVYSNGEMITDLTRKTKIKTISLRRKRRSVGDGTAPVVLANTFFNATNNASVTLEGVTYPIYTLMVGGYDVTLNRFIETDIVTGNSKQIKYYEEDITLIYKANTWATRVKDRGSYYYNVPVAIGDNGANKANMTTIKIDAAGNSISSDFALNGGGRAYGHSSDPNTTQSMYVGNGGKTPQGVEIDEATSLAPYDTTLAFLFHPQLNFELLLLTRGLD